MITLNDKSLEFSYMGFFTTENEWIHPTTSVKTYELIFVTEGEAHLFEKGKNYSLKKGDLILLDKNTEHGGFKKSFGNTALSLIFGRLQKVQRQDYQNMGYTIWKG